MLLCPNFCFKTHWFQTTAFRRESTIVWPYLWAYFTSLYTINMIYLGTCSSCTYEKLFPYARYHICARYVMYARSLARHFKNCRYLLLSSKRYNLLFAKLFLWFQECLLNIYYLKTTFWNLHFFLSFFFFVLQRASRNEYFDMVIFMTFFILVSIVCFSLLLKVSLTIKAYLINYWQLVKILEL